MRLPPWLKKNQNAGAHVHEIKKGMRARGLATVCEEARCPNQGECFACGTATFMIMGDVCTRHCGFCAVKNGTPKPLNPDEPSHVAEQVREMKLRHAVVTSVTRDDLPDGGAAHFAATIGEIRKLCTKTTIEVLTPDFEGRHCDIKAVCDARPDVFNHNVETVERLTPHVRNKASYKRSLEVLKMAGGVSQRTKSGLMVGLGETEEEIIKTINDLHDAGCSIVTIGQYLRPTKGSLPVAEYIRPDRFKKYQLLGEKIGIKHMFCGPFVRSSYMAERGYKEQINAKDKPVDSDQLAY